MKIDLSSPVAAYVSITFELMPTFPGLNTTFVPKNFLFILFSNVTFFLTFFLFTHKVIVYCYENVMNMK